LIARTGAASRRRNRVGLLYHLGGGNLGDDATLAVVRRNIESRWPDAEILGFTMNPEDTRRRHGIPSYPLRRKTWDLGPRSAPGKLLLKENARILLRKWRPLFSAFRTIHAVVVRFPATFLKELVFLGRSFSRLRSLDILLVAGGGQLTDWLGTWQFPYTIFTWVLLARLAGAKCIFLNVGAGPLARPLARFFVKCALFCSEYVSFRDDESRALARSTGFKGKTSVFPDSVYALESLQPDSRKEDRSAQPAVGIAPMPFYDPRSVYREKDQHVYDVFVDTLASFGSWLIENQYAVTLLCTDIGVDPPVIEDLKMNLGRHVAPSDVRFVASPAVTSIDELRCALSSLDYFVTCRFHGIVFAHILNIPVLAISHHPKMDALMGGLGLGQYCVDIHAIESGVLRGAFESLVRNRDAVKGRMEEYLSKYRKQLSQQFDELIGGGFQLLFRESKS
jgi:polysaccharide pyruvyl transferase WcaK-like protein